MKYSKQEIIDITKQIKNRLEKKYSTKLNHTISDTIFDNKNQYWVVIGVYELFREEEYFFYHISDDTGKLIQTLDKQRYNPHLPEYKIEDENLSKEWDDYERDNSEDFV